MPFRPHTPCRYPQCKGLVINYADNRGYCEVHRKTMMQPYDMRRESSVERGYDWTWHKVRNMKLNHDPLCEVCKKEGRVEEAREVHHIKPISEGGDRLSMDNLQSVCIYCHGKMREKKD